jgi:hypothetical protein
MEHIFKNLIDSLGLASGLRVISSAKRDFRSKGFMKLCPESGSELSTMI